MKKIKLMFPASLNHYKSLNLPHHVKLINTSYSKNNKAVKGSYEISNKLIKLEMFQLLLIFNLKCCYCLIS
jgi:hypothetical protein